MNCRDKRHPQLRADQRTPGHRRPATPAQLAELARDGYAAVINLALPTSDHAIVNEGELVTRAGLSCVHIPVAFDAPAPADFETFRGVMRALAGRKMKKVAQLADPWGGPCAPSRNTGSSLRACASGEIQDARAAEAFVLLSGRFAAARLPGGPSG